MLKLLILLVRNRTRTRSCIISKDATSSNIVVSKNGQKLSSSSIQQQKRKPALLLQLFNNDNNTNGVLLYWLERFGWYSDSNNYNSLQVQSLDGTSIGLNGSYDNNNNENDTTIEKDDYLNDSIYFAVPKSKITRSKKRMKTTTQKAIKYKHNIVTDPLTNEISLQHKLPINWKDYINFDMFNTSNTTTDNDTDNSDATNNTWIIGKPVTWTKNFITTAGQNIKKKRKKSDFIVDNRSTTSEEKIKQEQQKRQQSGQKLLE